MTEGITFRFCDGEDRYASGVSEIREFVDQLQHPKASLLTNPAGLSGYLDFQVLDDRSIEMEIMEHAGDDFATIDLAIAIRVIEIAITDRRDLTLRRKLDGLPIRWLT